MEPSLNYGDKLRMVFYERFDEDDDKWRGRSRTPDAGFHQFTELCGDYVVQEDGSLSLPILGRFVASGHNNEQVTADITRAFTSLLGRNGFVNIISVEHQPVFVVGSVKNPGAFKYWRGMTVLHALALAGGPKSVDRETWQSVESVREMDRLQRSLALVKRLLVRTSLLRAEGGGPPIPTETLAGLVGPDAPSLGSEEQAARQLVTQTQVATANALGTAVEDARVAVKARAERVTPLEGLITMRQQREKAISQLVANDTISTPVLVQTQSETADAQDRNRQALIEVAQARDHLAEAEHDFSKHQTDGTVEIARATQVAERSAQDAVGDAEGALDLIAALAPKGGVRDGLPETYQIVRRTELGTVTLDLPGTAPLEPGDLVKLTSDKTP
ncbi:MAG: polysaccharide biosynthesis/export family protein [Janthinobacterium lividum]